MRLGIVLSTAAVLSAAPARAEELRAQAEPAPSRHLFYAEAFGKGGLYGLGYEYALTPWLSLGGAGSYAVIRDQQIATVAPYLHAKLLKGARHALVADLGAVLARSHVPSPVNGWDGMTDAGGGGFVSLGWERDSEHFLVRVTGSLVVGEGGAAPWFGVAIGFRP